MGNTISSSKQIDYSGIDGWLHQQKIISRPLRHTTQKSTSLLHRPVTNVMILLILTITAYLQSLFMNLQGEDVAGLIKIFSPCLAGLLTIIIYFIVRIFFKSYAWIITVAGIACMLYESIALYA